MRPNLRASMPSQAALHMLKQPPRLVSSTSSQAAAVHLLHGGVAGDAGIVDDESTGPSSASTCCHARCAVVEIDDVPFEGRDAGACR